MRRVGFAVCATVCLTSVSGFGPSPAQAEEVRLDALKHNVEVSPNGRIRLPLRVHIMSDLQITHPAARLTCWFKQSHVDPVLKEVNLIWRQANIEWFVESVVEHKPATENMAHARYIVNAKRDSGGRSDPERIPKVYEYFDVGRHNPAIQNLYFFPFIGNTSQGYARDPDDVANRSSNHAVVGIWSNKYSQSGTPYRTPVGERSKNGTPDTPPQDDNYFRKGSLGRTCAHELGHHLRLSHPKPETQTELRRLMGGQKQAYVLTKNEISVARTEATKRAKSIIAWDADSIRDEIAGTFRRVPATGDWHEGTITAVQKPAAFRWKNKAGISWGLTLDAERGVLKTGQDNPHFDSNPRSGREFRLVLKRHSKAGNSVYRVTGFRFQAGYFERQSN